MSICLVCAPCLAGAMAAAGGETALALGLQETHEQPAGVGLHALGQAVHSIPEQQAAPV